MDLIRQCLAAGADGVLLKDTEPDELLRCLRLVAAGDDRPARWSAGSGLGMIADRAAMLGGQLELTIDADRDGLIIQRLTLPAGRYDR
jgi:DNA-binding NarL/FixJ family response regulator